MAKVVGTISVNKMTGNISYQQPSGVVAVNPITVHAMTGSITGAAIISGIMQAVGSLSGTVTAAAITAGTLTGTGALNGPITGAAIVAGDLTSKSIPFLLTSTGNGTGVSTLTMAASEDTILTLDGTAKFYSDAGGTSDESSTWIVTTGGSRTRYIKCPSDTANFVIEKNTITQWSAWTSGANAASISGDISRLTALTVISVTGSNILSGSIAGLTSLDYLTVTGSNILSGSFNALTLLTRINIEGSNTVTGDLSLISALLNFCNIIGDNQIVTYTAGGDWSSITDQSYIYIVPGVGYGLSSAEVDLFINEVESTRAVDRHLHLTLTGSCEARTAASDTAVAAIIADGGTVTTNP